MTAADTSSSASRGSRSGVLRGILVILPLIGFASIAALFYARLSAGDPSRLPSALVGHPAPSFSLAAVPGLDRPGLSRADLASGHVTVMNVFASWCVECHEEHEALLALGHDPALTQIGARVVGLAYKDQPEDTRRYLNDKGNPFAAVGYDGAGRTGIDFGVYGVPETFVIRPDGTISYKLVGGVTADTVKPLLAAIRDANR